jgi:regulatory protein YycI of two-component signal transduction system YycFG
MKSLSQTGLAALLIVIIVVTVILLVLGSILLKDLSTKQEEHSGSASVQKTKNLNHPKLYQALLEYDPARGTILQLKTETASGFCKSPCHYSLYIEDSSVDPI